MTDARPASRIVGAARTRKSVRICGIAGVMMALLTLSGCACTGTSVGTGARSETELTNKRVVGELYAAFQHDDVEAIIALVDDDVVWVEPGPKSIPFADRFVGKDGVRRFFRAVANSSEVLQFDVLDTYSHDDRVMVTGYERLRALATGKEYRTRWIHSYRLRNGKIVEFEEFDDTAAQVVSFTPNPTK